MKRFITSLLFSSTMLISAAAETRRPNILFILVDDLKPTLGCYGDAKAITPHMDALAGTSLLFTAAYANQAVCAPSRNALLTGLRPSTIGVYDLRTNFRLGVPHAVTMPQTFFRAGYRTISFGKVYHPGNGDASDDAAWSVPHFDGRNGHSEYALPHDDRPAMEFADVDDDSYDDGRIAAEAIRRLNESAAQPDQPFLMMVGFRRPHLPFCAPKKYWDMHAGTAFAPDGPSGPPKDAPVFAGTSWGELRNYSDIPDVGPLNDAQSRELVRGYYAATSYVDAQIGRVLDELTRLRLDDNTIVVLWGDHGWHLGDHGFWCKHTNYEQAAHIPLLIRVPGLTTPGSRSSALIETDDLYPTLCALTGVQAPEDLDGISEVAVLRDPTVHLRSDAYHVYPRHVRGQGQLIGRALRTARYRLVEWKLPGADPSTAILELYDYVEDPQETRNLAAARPEVVHEMLARLAQFPEAKPQIPGARAKPARKTEE